MSYVSITPTEIQPGKPVRADTQNKVKENFDDHEARIQSLEGGNNTTYPPLTFRVDGPYGYFTVGQIGTNVTQTTTNFPITFTGCRLLIDTAGTSGTTEIDVKYKRGAGSWTSILTTKPSVNFSAGNNAISSNGVLNPAEVNLLAGDLIRVDLTSIQVGAIGFTVRLDFNRT